MKVVVDASVAVKWFFDEELKEAADRLLLPPYELHAPDFLRLELDSVFGKRLRRGEITVLEADRLAMTLDVKLVTADHKFFLAIQGHFLAQHVRWITHLT